MSLGNAETHPRDIYLFLQDTIIRLLPLEDVSFLKKTEKDK